MILGDIIEYILLHSKGRSWSIPWRQRYRTRLHYLVLLLWWVLLAISWRMMTSLATLMQWFVFSLDFFI